ncbi:MAG: septum formation initiator family protein [Ignavibacteria bacterium]|nr:septum formation initiator family protein [Ignavibacteria bacterium]
MKDDGFFRNIVKFVYQRRKFFLYLLILAVILSYAVFGKKGILQRVELEMENRDLKEKLRTEQEKTMMLQKEVEELKTSDKKIEKFAREKYGMVKDGEEIYKVVTDSTK